MSSAVKILIIDDSPDDQLIYRRALSKAADTKYEVIEAEDGDRGLERVEADRPDCVLLDYSLPGRNGIEVLKRLRQKHPYIPVAMLTGQGNETVAVAAMHEGAQNYISKSSITPTSIERLISVSIEHCGMQKRIHEQRASLEAANKSLEAEIVTRRHAEKATEAQLERLSLLHHITRAIGERQDIDSIFQVVVRNLEDRLSVEFACLCLYDRTEETLRLARVGLKNDGLARELLSADAARLSVKENGLNRCVHGEFVYEPDISDSAFPFHRTLAHAGLKSLVLAPLQVENQNVGVLILARTKLHGFNEDECDFVRQLTEHVALAAHHVQLYEALQQAYDKLRQTQQAVMQHERLRAVGQMASGIAHDINNALSPVALYTQALLDSERNLSPRARGYLETTQRAIEDVAHTVARLRDFYRQREVQSALAPVQLNQLTQHAVDLTRARWFDMSQQRGVVIDVKTDVMPELPVVMGTESEIREALVNLILNAVDAMPDGGTVTVRTKTGHNKEGKRAVRVEVADTGAGMSEETRRHCLEPFFTTKGERGTGLGLAMVYGIAQRHGAQIEIDSEVGKGTTVSMVFPTPETPVSASEKAEQAVAGDAKLRLLLVDDDPLVLQSLRATLEIDGHTVIAANDGQSGIDAFRSAVESGEKFDAVITDLGMPHVDGRKVAATVKQLSPKTPVVLLTGWGQSLATSDDAPAHVDAILGKPPKLRDLRKAMGELCKAQ
ncbi:MAG: response regulator [Alphaproteobacteria bacterium]|nr:response regulator [Alphaproteobacteria bacterium]